MQANDYSAVLGMLEDGRIEVESVGAFWQQARRIRVPGAGQPVVAVPVTFHLVGEIRSVAYAQLLVGPGLNEARTPDSPSSLVWFSRPNKLAPLAFSEFTLPMAGLFWTGEDDPAALKLGSRLLEMVLQDFPNPEWELEQHFSMPLDRIFKYLAETEYREAGATLRSKDTH